MKRSVYLASLALLMALSYVAGSWNRDRPSTTSAAGGREVLYYHDPMHPAYKSDKPGIAPDCGMQLEAVYADGGGSEGEGLTASLPPGTLRVSVEKQQLMGIRVKTVERMPIDSTLRTIGRVAVDETRVVRLTATDGWLERAHPQSAGSLVRKGDLLATFFSRDFQSAQVSYFYALGSLDKLPKDKAESTGAPAQVQILGKELRALGMSDLQLEEITRTHKAATEIDLRSPITGFILARKAVAGMKVEKGEELYRIADLSRIWILTDIFGGDARRVRPGTEAEVSFPQENRLLQARVSNVLPEFDPATRTMKMRLETDNPGYALRPDMFVDVVFHIKRPPLLAVPAEAVLDTGLRKIAFVDLGNGRFEPRRVETGQRFNDLIEIVDGLREGERVAVSGNFLLDSESRMQAAAQGLHDDAVDDPVCGMKVDSHKAGDSRSVYAGRTYYFCNPSCKERFDREPERHLKKQHGIAS